MSKLTIPPRLHDWRVRLTEYLTGVMHRPFRAGQHDCALFVAGAVEAMTGVDAAVGWRGYKTLAAGKEKLSAAGYPDHVALVSELLPEVAPAFAQVGDVAVLPADQGAALGIVQGERVYCLRPEGMVMVSRLAMERAFRV